MIFRTFYSYIKFDIIILYKIQIYGGPASKKYVQLLSGGGGSVK